MRLSSRCADGRRGSYEVLVRRRMGAYRRTYGGDDFARVVNDGDGLLDGHFGRCSLAACRGAVFSVKKGIDVKFDNREESQREVSEESIPSKLVVKSVDRRRKGPFLNSGDDAGATVE